MLLHDFLEYFCRKRGILSNLDISKGVNPSDTFAKR